MDAARAEFARVGLAGARVNRIAAASGANKERIYANFGSKEGLFEAVMADALAAHAASFGTWDATPEAIVDRLFDRHRVAPDLLRLMLWEALEYNAAPVPAEAARRDHYRDRIAALGARFELDDRAEAGAALLVLIGLAAWPAVLPQLARMLTPEADPSGFEAALRKRLHRAARAILSSQG